MQISPEVACWLNNPVREMGACLSRYLDAAVAWFAHYGLCKGCSWEIRGSIGLDKDFSGKIRAVLACPGILLCVVLEQRGGRLGLSLH